VSCARRRKSFILSSSDPPHNAYSARRSSTVIALVQVYLAPSVCAWLLVVWIRSAVGTDRKVHSKSINSSLAEMFYKKAEKSARERDEEERHLPNIA
jgi:hypothetical protein